MTRSNAIASLWEIAKALRIGIDNRITELRDLPYTISYVIRKRVQVDGFMELSKEQRPDDFMIYEATSEELESWLERILSGKEKQFVEIPFSEDEIE